MELKGKTILITGGASGIGMESAEQFLAEGAKVIVSGRNQEKLNAVKLRLPAVTVIKSDVSDRESSKELFLQVQKLGGIDILYNNAGVGSEPRNLGKANEKHFEEAEYEMNINYLGIISLIDLFIEMLKKRPEAAIINTTSILSYLPSILAPTYSATKAALRFYTESLRKHLEIIESRVKVFELQPPLVKTEMTDNLNEKKMSPADLVKALIKGIKKNNYTIRVGDTKVVYLLNRLFPKVTFNILNQKKNFGLLK